MPQIENWMRTDTRQKVEELEDCPKPPEKPKQSNSKIVLTHPVIGNENNSTLLAVATAF